VEREQPEILAELAMVALLRFLDADAGTASDPRPSKNAVP
jgi:hypothetical protein